MPMARLHILHCVRVCSTGLPGGYLEVALHTAHRTQQPIEVEDRAQREKSSHLNPFIRAAACLSRFRSLTEDFASSPDSPSRRDKRETDEHTAGKFTRLIACTPAKGLV